MRAVRVSVLAAVGLLVVWSAVFGGAKPKPRPRKPAPGAKLPAAPAVLFPIVDGARAGFINQSGKLVASGYGATGPFAEGLAPFQVDGKWGYLGASGKPAIPLQFDAAGAFSEGLAPVRVGALFGYVDKAGKLALAPKYDEAHPFRGGLAVVKLQGKYGAIGKSGGPVIEPTYEALGTVAEGLLAASQGGKWGFLDKTGAVVVPPQFERAGDFSSGLAPAWSGGKAGFIDKTGAWVTQPKYDDAQPFHEGRAAVGLQKQELKKSPEGRVIGVTRRVLWGYVDASGREAIPLQFPGAGAFSSGLAPVLTDAGWGYADQTGKLVIPARYDAAEPFDRGLARVHQGEGSAYLSPTGKVVWAAKGFGQAPGQPAAPAAKPVDAARPAAATAPAPNEPPFRVSETLNADASQMKIVKGTMRASPDGRHFAFAIEKEGKQALVVDGDAGPAHDGVIKAPSFSPDGRHVLYYLAGADGTSERAVVDGQEGPPCNRVDNLVFSPDSKRVGYLADHGGTMHAVIDGVDQPEYQVTPADPTDFRILLCWLTFSPDSTRVAYSIKDRDGQVMVVDGTPSAHYDEVGAPTFSPDSRHVIYRAEQGGKSVLVRDGQKGREYDSLQAAGEHFSPDSQHVSYVAQRGGRSLGVVDANETAEYDELYYVGFSPDSAHTCFVAGRGEKHLPVIDGLEGQEYDEIEHISFGPDSRRTEFPAKRAGQAVMVIDGIESREYDSTAFGAFFSPDARRVAFSAKRGEKYLAVVDGVEGAPYDNVQPMVFSPDSKHIAWWAKQGERWTLLIDGAEVKTWDGFLAPPIFDSGSRLHTLVYRGNVVYLVEVAISGSGAMAKPAPSAAPVAPPAGGAARPGTMRFSYNVANGPFVRRVTGTIANPQGLLDALAPLQPPPGARGAYGLMGDDALLGQEDGYGLRTLGQLARQYLTFDAFYLEQPEGWSEYGVQSGHFTSVDDVNDATLGWLFFDLRPMVEQEAKEFLKP